jgi:hypothetical protein
MSPFLRRCAALFRQGQDVEQAWDGPESTAGQPTSERKAQEIVRKLCVNANPHTASAANSRISMSRVEWQTGIPTGNHLATYRGIRVVIKLSKTGSPTEIHGISTGFWQKVLRSTAIWSQPRKLVLIWPIGASQMDDRWPQAIPGAPQFLRTDPLRNRNKTRKEPEVRIIGSEALLRASLAGGRTATGWSRGLHRCIIASDSFPDICKHVMASSLGSSRRIAIESFA